MLIIIVAIFSIILLFIIFLIMASIQKNWADSKKTLFILVPVIGSALTICVVILSIINQPHKIMLTMNSNAGIGGGDSGRIFIINDYDNDYESILNEYGTSFIRASQDEKEKIALSHYDKKNWREASFYYYKLFIEDPTEQIKRDFISSSYMYEFRGEPLFLNDIENGLVFAYVDSDNEYLLSLPDQKAEKIEKLEAKEILIILEQGRREIVNSGNAYWYLCEYKNQRGWVHGANLLLFFSL